MSMIRSTSISRVAACAVAVLLLAGVGPAAAGAQTVLDPDAPVMVTGGAIRGAVSASNADIVAFKGIPFAAPPVGDLRWRPPEPVTGWEGVRDASESGAICVQNGGESVTQDEDCLFLNVWAPRETSEPRPVLFWIHGGGYTGGSGSTAIYDGTPLAADGAVVVTINYRLNVFGFLAHPALSAESPHGASGNYGLLDMVAALEWVRDNIATFGGDPGRVTIFGESAGGGAVMSVMLMPQAEGLFHGAIAQSNWINGWDRPLAEAARGWEAGRGAGPAGGHRAWDHGKYRRSPGRDAGGRARPTCWLRPTPTRAVRSCGPATSGPPTSTAGSSRTTRWQCTAPADSTPFR